MTILALAILAASAAVDEPGPAELVRLLGSSDRVEREEAARTLEELGADALPALRDAAKTATGDARSRASSLARLIEGRRLDRPSLVALDFRGQPLEDVLRTLGTRASCTFRLDPRADAEMARRPIVATAEAPVPFWEALDRVGRAGHVRHDPGAIDAEASPVPVLPITDGDPPRSTVYRGAFRVHLVAIRRRRDRDLGSGPGKEPTSRDVLQLDLQVFAEPGRFLDFAGAPRIEAEDDRGRRLLSSPSEGSWSQHRFPPWQVPGAIAVLQWRVPLELTGAGVAKTLRRLRGALPVIVSAARTDGLAIPMDGAAGQAHRVDDVTLRLQPFRPAAGMASVEMTLTREPAPDARRDAPPAEVLLHRFAFEDRDGRPLPWIPRLQNAGAVDRIPLRILFSQGQRPARLRFHELAWNATEIPFEFEDVPLP